jgi:hypothetical protein
MHTTNPQSNTRPDASGSHLAQAMTRQMMSSNEAAALPDNFQEQA